MESTVTPPETDAFANAVALLRDNEFLALAELAESKTRDVAAARSVVVVGEVKRGKSTLVNALLGIPDASPVDVDVTTSASVRLMPESEQLPSGWAELVFPGETRRVPSAELADWVTKNGRYVADPGTDVLPTSVLVPVASDPFDGAIVVDTPGAGGLDAAHAQLALQSAQQACVLVVVADASSPLTAPEMEFIRSTSATVESIIVVVSKTDKNIRRWRAIVEQNHLLLREHLQRDLPVVGVSSMRALAASRLPVGAQREGHLATSGIIGLRELIRQRLALGETLATVDGMRTALEGLRSIRDRLHADITVTKAGAAVLPELTAQRDRLQELKEHSGQWEINLTRDMTFARQAALEHLDRALDEVKKKWTVRIHKQGLTALRGNRQVFTAEIEADLMGALGSTMELFVQRVHAIAEPLFPSPEPWADIYRIMIATLSKPERLSAGELAKIRHGLFDPTMVSLAGSGGTMLTGIAAHVGLGMVTGGATLAVGGVWMVVNLAHRAMKQGKNNLVLWLRETLGVTKTTASRMLEAAMVTSRTEIVLRHRADLRERTEKVTKQLNEAKVAAQQDAAVRDKRVVGLAQSERAMAAAIAELEQAIESRVAR